MVKFSNPKSTFELVSKSAHKVFLKLFAMTGMKQFCILWKIHIMLEMGWKGQILELEYIWTLIYL